MPWIGICDFGCFVFCRLTAKLPAAYTHLQLASQLFRTPQVLRAVQTMELLHRMDCLERMFHVRNLSQTDVAALVRRPPDTSDDDWDAPPGIAKTKLTTLADQLRAAQMQLCKTLHSWGVHANGRYQVNVCTSL